MGPPMRVSTAMPLCSSTPRLAGVSRRNQREVMADIVLSLNNVDKVYQRRGRAPVHAVKKLNMTVGRGEIVALLGSSGCGKTSTLRMIAGFEAVSDGDIVLADRRIDQLPPARRGVAMAFEGYSLYPPLTVRDNIAFALKGARLNAKEVEKSVAEISRLVDIEGILDRYPSSISGGQQQRASLARALVRRADLYLLDEPMGQLEPQLRALLRGRLKSLLVDRRMTSIFVTHDQTEANALADRIAVMEGGLLQQFASQKELRDRPANLFVATFIGEPPMNVFEAAVENSERVRFSTTAGPTFDFAASTIPPNVRGAIGARDKVVVGFRPHAVRLGAGANEARIVSNQWLGDQSHLAIGVGGKLLVTVSHKPIAAKAGETIRYDVAAADLHVFDAISEAAVSHGLETA
jgi:multiple sugar transport system ATP-binding protein